MDQLTQEKRPYLPNEKVPVFTHREWLRQKYRGELRGLLADPGRLETLADQYSENDLRLETLATHDGLTGLLNFKGFTEALKENLLFIRQNGINAYLAFLDIDKLKELNDTEGKIAGNKLIKTYADVLRNVTGLFPETPFLIGRFGGDECVILAVGMNEEEMLALTETIRTDLPEAVQRTFQNPSMQRTVSIGITAVEPNDDVETLLDRADRRLKEAKETRNHTVMR